MHQVSAKSAYQVSVFSSSQKVYSNNTCSESQISFDCLAEAFFRLAIEKMSDTQKTILVASAEILRTRVLTITGLADILSCKTKVPYSTAKWNLRALMNLGLVTGGNSENKGEPSKLTPPAMLLVSYLEEQKE
ncbi:MAG: hypothetical protein BAJATHORv1_10197 [Candidatus Thorarchaeota archaeon]|nr:MAG: hypothetical protein BAJATHORv1_10197 [Candidatus Thorarchaeota archaeon]